ncbi:hypothetical protein PGT21_028851 [Puccinia graminis f. sp. tritici]|uniref:Uncharacterized protein n=1 Tax=Puccinia graminis f. sp. tritici TaxID=56615 RepID=A0A5B0QP83_PUCGR|nr:hypothetical protein PGT21_028851 [Puccinia graminis f. sp. tritici]
MPLRHASACRDKSPSLERHGSEPHTNSQESIIMAGLLLAHLKCGVVKKKQKQIKKSKRSKPIEAVDSSSHVLGSTIATPSTIPDVPISQISSENPLVDVSTGPCDEYQEAELCPAGPVDSTNNTREANQLTVIAVEPFNDESAEAMIHPAFRGSNVRCEPALLPVEQREWLT